MKSTPEVRGIGVSLLFVHVLVRPGTIAFVPLLNIIQNDPESLEAAIHRAESPTRPRPECMSAARACLSFISIYVVGHGAVVSILAPFCSLRVRNAKRIVHVRVTRWINLTVTSVSPFRTFRSRLQTVWHSAVNIVTKNVAWRSVVPVRWTAGLRAVRRLTRITCSDKLSEAMTSRWDVPAGRLLASVRFYVSFKANRVTRNLE